MAQGRLKFYILAASPGLSPRNLTFKHGDTFALFNAEGDIVPGGLGELGLYHQGTRFLSRLELFCCETKPFLLSSSPSPDGLLIQVNLTNPDLLAGDLFVPRGSLHIKRLKLLYQGAYYEELVFTNYALESLEIPVKMVWGADFADLFEVRGVKRIRRGHVLPPEVTEEGVRIRYHGLDGVDRTVELSFSEPPGFLSPEEAHFTLHLLPRERRHLVLSVRCVVGEEVPERRSFREALFLRRAERKELLKTSVRVESSNEHFNRWLERSEYDLFMMLTPTPYGLYPYAGIPWFSTVFGRDGLIVGLQTLWFNPEIARGVLEVLAATQATERDPARDAEPGKILHEMRFSEMAATGEVPFGRYYGSVDATLLFMILAGAYYERTQDLDFVRRLWPHLEMAFEWMKNYGDLDGDGLVEYQPSEEGLVNKGWKDSHDSVFHADGTFPRPPIALVEVQGYAYRACLEMARLSRALGKHDLVLHFLSRAEDLREKIYQAFLSGDFPALALDGTKRPCLVRTSNPGHLLFAEVLSEAEALVLTRALLSPDLFSGWGIRTLGRKEILYNPVSYHNGSVWPHDNALIVQGFDRYGLKEAVERVFQSLFEASHYFPHHRLPELFCGFSRRAEEGPVQYPVACSPQAWASGAVFMLLAASLGLRFTAKGLAFMKPRLPEFLSWVRLKGMRVGDHTVDLEFLRYGHDVVVNVLRKPKSVEILVVK